MSIDKFDLATFEERLAEAATSAIGPQARVKALDLVLGEHEFIVVDPDDEKVSFRVRSSVNASGQSADTGDNSIRLWPVLRRTGKPVGKSADAYTNRLPGWESRMAKKLALLHEWRGLAGDCPTCGEPKLVLISRTDRNPNRMFAKCSKHNHFQWLDEVKPDDRSEENVVCDEADSRPESTVARDSGSTDDLAPVSAVQDGARLELPASGVDSSGEVDGSGSLPPVFGFLTDGDAPVTAPDAGGKAASVPAPAQAEAITLNQYQQAAVDDILSGGAIVSEAAPGSGKTRMLEHAVAALIEAGIEPTRILAVTFTAKAAAELRLRVGRTVFPDASDAELNWFEDPYDQARINALGMSEADFEAWQQDPRRQMLVRWTCTIHALSLRLLKAAGHKVNVLAPDVKNYQQRKLFYDHEDLIRNTIEELEIDDDIKAVKDWVSKAICAMVEPKDADAWFAEQLTRYQLSWKAPKMAELYRRRQGFLKTHKLVDFDMMQSRVRYLLRHDSNFRAWATGLFDRILVDEAQDTDTGQAEILWTLAEESSNIVFCGDVDQGMYRFRGADSEVLRSHFEERWPTVSRHNLPINYRSTHSIIEWCERLITTNYPGDLSTYLKPFQARPDASDGVPVTYHETSDTEELAENIAAWTSERPGDWFVLSRTRAECSLLHTELVARGIPSINKSGGLIMGARHVRKVLAYLALAVDHNGARDDLEYLTEIANVASVDFRAPFNVRNHRDGCDAKPWANCGCPIVRHEGVSYCHTRYYSKVGAEKAGCYNGAYHQQWDRNRKGYLTTWAKATQDLVAFVEGVERYHGNATVAIEYVIENCVLPWLAATEGAADADLAEGKAEDFTVLLSLAEPDDTVEDYLNRLDDLSRADSPGDESQSVVLGTIHWSKGAERPRVIANVTRLPIVPPPRNPDRLPVGGGVDIAEERRLLFVAVSRAKEEAIVAASAEWQNKPMPRSIFVEEMGMA